MKEKTIKSRLAFILTALIIVLIALFSYQYFLFKSESSEILNYLIQKEHQLIQTKQYSEKVEQRIRETDRELSAARVLMPVSLDVRSFMEDFERLAKGSGVIVENFIWNEEEREFYRKAYCTIKLSGDEKGIKSLRERKDEIKRLVVWGEEKPLDTGVEIKLMIYSTPQQKPKQFDVDAFKQSPCKEFISKVRLWPFSKRIREIKEELDNICLELGEHAEEVQKIELLKSKIQEAKYLINMIHYLESQQ